jgi:phosphoribosylamine--glycine ligase
MNVLILGSGGREHAFAWKIAQSPLCSGLFIAPGNAGTSDLGQNLKINPENFEAVANAVNEHKIDLLLVGPEAPLVAGIRDWLEGRPEFSGLRIIGPGREGAALEGSKDVAKRFLARHGIPTAAYETFSKHQVEEAKAFLRATKAPYVLKADGLAAGKGVVILSDLAEAEREIQAMLADAKFGEASARVVIEAFLDGIELSVFALTDGKKYVLLPEAKDYKRIGEGDKGLNTGGMGAVSPVPFADKAFMQKVISQVVEPTIDGLAKDGIPYVGFVFFGLIKVGDDPFVIEYNVRMGDPETEVVLPRLKSDLLEMLIAAADGKLSGYDVEFDERAATTVMLVSGGYPEAYEKGKVISGIEAVEDALVFHAGTRSEGGKVLSDGGRVMALTAYGTNMKEALGRSNAGANKIQFEGKNFRRDIGFDL